MNEHNITNTSLALSMLLVVVAMLISHKEKLALEKDILWSVCRAVIQLIIVGYVLKYIFGVNHAALTLLMVLFICFNAMMSGLIFAGIDPVKAIKYQIMVTFMLLSTASLSTIIACYLTYRKFYNSRHQLVVTQLKKK